MYHRIKVPQMTGLDPGPGSSNSYIWVPARAGRALQLCKVPFVFFAEEKKTGDDFPKIVAFVFFCHRRNFCFGLFLSTIGGNLKTFVPIYFCSSCCWFKCYCRRRRRRRWWCPEQIGCHSVFPETGCPGKSRKSISGCIWQQQRHHHWQPSLLRIFGTENLFVLNQLKTRSKNFLY